MPWSKADGPMSIGPEARSPPGRTAGPQASLGRAAGQFEDLSRIDQVGIADLTLVGFVDDSVAKTAAVGTVGDQPQAIARLHDDRLIAGRHIHRFGPRERRFDAGDNFAVWVDFVDPQAVKARCHEIIGPD